MSVSRIRTKAQMYRLYESGRFGNRLPAWDSLEDYYASGFADPVVLRYKGSRGGQWVQYDVPLIEVPRIVKRWEEEGADLHCIVVNALGPASKLVFQGEVMRSFQYIDLRYSLTPKPMRLALAEDEREARGVKAKCLLKHFMDPASYDDLWSLLTDFDDAVVEFSTWSVDIGVAPNRNTVFWEVRHY